MSYSEHEWGLHQYSKKRLMIGVQITIHIFAKNLMTRGTLCSKFDVCTVRKDKDTCKHVDESKGEVKRTVMHTLICEY